MEGKQHPADPGRRHFMRRAGLGALAAGTAGLAGAQPADTGRRTRVPGTDYDVVVIGGGNAGAAAARDSMENGYRTLLLEARNRLGGRTFTADFEGSPVELGGFWIHPTQPFVWAETERYGLEVVETPGAAPDRMLLKVDDALIELTETQLFEGIAGWQTYTENARTILPRPFDLLFNEAAALEADRISAVEKLETLALSDFQKQFIRSLLASMAHNEPETMSYLEVVRWHVCGGGYFPTFMDAVARFYLKDGSIALVEKMIDDGRPEVRLSTPVKSVRDVGHHVEVTTLRGEKITAGAVIACLPMNTIFDIDFTPPLPPGVVAAGRQGHTGSGVKLYMKVHGNVGNLMAMSVSGPLDMVMTYKQSDDQTLLVGFARSPDVLDVYDDAAVEAALQTLVPGARLISSMSYDWNNDPYARGTYCCYRPGWVAKYYDQFQKSQGRVFFGSSDHGEGWRGFIDGAIGGGIRAAQDVKALLEADA